MTTDVDFVISRAAWCDDFDEVSSLSLKLATVITNSQTQGLLSYSILSSIRESAGCASSKTSLVHVLFHKSPA